jgi:hypothetical protein
MCIAVAIEISKQGGEHLRYIGNIKGDVIERRPKLQNWLMAA